MSLIRAKVADGRVLDLIEDFLKVGTITAETNSIPTEGSPQGGVISPLIANIVLNQLARLQAATSPSKNLSKPSGDLWDMLTISLCWLQTKKKRSEPFGSFKKNSKNSNSPLVRRKPPSLHSGRALISWAFILSSTVLVSDKNLSNGLKTKSEKSPSAIKGEMSKPSSRTLTRSFEDGRGTSVPPRCLAFSETWTSGLERESAVSSRKDEIPTIDGGYQRRNSVNGACYLYRNVDQRNASLESCSNPVRDW